jgi:hypothetical protein
LQLVADGQNDRVRSAPGILKIFGFIPVVGPLIALVGFVWQIVAMVVAVRHTLGYTSTMRAVVIVIPSLVAINLFSFIVGIVIGATVMPFFEISGP